MIIFIFSNAHPYILEFYAQLGDAYPRDQIMNCRMTQFLRRAINTDLKTDMAHAEGKIQDL